MPLSSMLSRGAYIAPYLDPLGSRIVLLIDRNRHLAHRYLAPDGDVEAILCAGRALLDVLDPPRISTPT